jgi:hypothetical protein
MEHLDHTLVSFVDAGRQDLATSLEGVETPYPPRELVLLNFLGRIGNDPTYIEPVREVSDAGRALYRAAHKTLETIQFEQSRAARLYTDGIQQVIGQALEQTVGNEQRGLAHATWVLCNEAYQRSLLFETVLESVDLAEPGINELYKNEWHQPDRIREDLRVSAARDSTSDGFEASIIRRAALIVRYQLVDEDSFMGKQLARSPDQSKRIQVVKQLGRTFKRTSRAKSP